MEETGNESICREEQGYDLPLPRLSVVHLTQAISKYKPYVLPACSFYGKNHPNLPDFT
jgi:hypothetical protein